MDLVIIGTFGSLPEATIAYSCLRSAGFNPVAAFNMNTPGTADGMAPSAYRILAPESEGQAAREFLAELAQSATVVDDDTDETLDETDEPDGFSTGILGGLRPIVRLLIGCGLVAWAVFFCLTTLRRCTGV